LKEKSLDITSTSLAFMPYFSCEKCGQTKIVQAPDDVHTEANRQYDSSQKPFKTSFKCENNDCGRLNFIYWYKPK
jgi:hypothetical protein